MFFTWTMNSAIDNVSTTIMNSYVASSAMSESVTTTQWLYIIGGILLTMECIFALVLYCSVLPNLNKLTEPHPYPSDELEFITRVLDTVDSLDCYNFDIFFAGFFRGAKLEDVYMDNFFSWLAWAMYGKELVDVSPEQLTVIKLGYHRAMERHPELANLKKGLNPKVKHVNMTLEPIRTIHRPLLLYVGAGLMELISNFIFLRLGGFCPLELNGMNYWYKPGKGTANSTNDHSSYTPGDEVPYVFFHGISTGWAVYMKLVKVFIMGSNRAAILIDMDAIKIKSMVFHVPSPIDYAKNVERILERHTIDKVSIVGHSFGTITAGWVLKHCPNRVSHVTLIDPVSLLLALPEVAYSFLYRPPSTFVEWVIYLAASREVTVAHALHRHFWWYQNIIWIDDIPDHIGVVVGVAGSDEITNPAALFEYVTKHSEHRRQLLRTSIEKSTDKINYNNKVGKNKIKKDRLGIAPVEFVMFPGHSHGQILLDSTHQSVFVKTIQQNECGTAAAAAAASTAIINY